MHKREIGRILFMSAGFVCGTGIMLLIFHSFGIFSVFREQLNILVKGGAKELEHIL